MDLFNKVFKNYFLKKVLQIQKSFWVFSCMYINIKILDIFSNILRVFSKYSIKINPSNLSNFKVISQLLKKKIQSRIYQTLLTILRPTSPIFCWLCSKPWLQTQLHKSTVTRGCPVRFLCPPLIAFNNHRTCRRCYIPFHQKSMHVKSLAPTCRHHFPVAMRPLAHWPTWFQLPISTVHIRDLQMGPPPPRDT